MKLLAYAHKKIISERRASVLSKLIADAADKNDRILDIGSGDGKIASLIKQNKPSIEISGIDLFERKKSFIEVRSFDGATIPFGEDTFNTSLLIDVLHHTQNPGQLLKEAMRVTKDYILIKDHVKTGILSEWILTFMDRMGNQVKGVPLPNNYLTKQEWNELFEYLNLQKEFYTGNLHLYSWLLHSFFDRNLHFFVKLNVNKNIY